MSVYCLNKELSTPNYTTMSIDMNTGQYGDILYDLGLDKQFVEQVVGKRHIVRRDENIGKWRSIAEKLKGEYAADVITALCDFFDCIEKGDVIIYE